MSVPACLCLAVTLAGGSAQCRDFPLGAERAAHSTPWIPVGGQGYILSQHPAARLHGSYINLHQLRDQPRPSHLPRAAAETECKSCQTPTAAPAAPLLPHSSGQAGAPGLAQDTQVSEPRPCWHSAPPGVTAARLL